MTTLEPLAQVDTGQALRSEERLLTVELLDTWHVGSGKAEGRHLDAVVERDAFGLPHVPGRMLKGLLRDAARAMEAWGHWPAGTMERLFGSDSQREDGATHPGRVAVSNAELPPVERQWLSQEAARAQRQALFVERFETAIDKDSGIAASGSLRGIERVIPLQLQCNVTLLAPQPRQGQTLEGRPGQNAADWALLTELLPLVRAIGADKTRGEGRAQLRWHTEGAQV